MTRTAFNKKPEIRVKGYDSHAWGTYETIWAHIKTVLALSIKSNPKVIIECYPGVLISEITSSLNEYLKPEHLVFSETALKSENDIFEMIKRNLTDDRIFGVMSHHHLEEFFDKDKLNQLASLVKSFNTGLTVIIGTGAALLGEADILVYADMARWEIQLRYRNKQIANLGATNFGEDFLRMYKRGYFVDWRVCDRHKKKLYNKIDYLLDTNTEGSPKLITGEAFRAGLKQTVARPFRVVPYYDPGPWGGQWIREVCGLDSTPPNYAWSFDGVPEENSLFMRFGDIQVEVPSINVVFFYPVELLGNRVHARFGEEFPIRFDFLDTMGGGNLSLQVHPTTRYIYEQFGIPYTQDESYYLLDAGEDSCVYLGLCNDANMEQMREDLEKAQAGDSLFDTEKYVNKIPAKKHDHFLIPAGTIHCSGRNSMVLEISATPYIFTFKLWDWGRLGLDGKPRPVHLDHGMSVINRNCREKMVYSELVNKIESISDRDGIREERTGLHEREFIETRRHWFSKSVEHHTGGGVNMLNLVEGEEITVRSLVNAFEPMVIRYAETFIVPAAVGKFIIEPSGPSVGKTCVTIKAFVRT